MDQFRGEESTCLESPRCVCGCRWVGACSPAQVPAGFSCKRLNACLECPSALGGGKPLHGMLQAALGLRRLSLRPGFPT